MYDKASLALIPSGTKAGTLYSVLAANGDGDFTHTRATSATRVNKDGLIESVASGVPRLDYPLIDGVVQDCPALLLEPSRTNIALYSEDFTNSVWSKTRSTITGNQAVSPDGSVTADKITGTGTGTSYFYDGFSVTSGTVYTISIFAKKINVNNFYINNFTQSGSITFDLSDGTIDTSASGTFSDGKIENYGNDWYRLSVQYTASATATVNIGFYGQDSTLDAAYVWGAQIETGSYTTSYIPTTTSTVTRNADVCNGAGTSAEFNDSEGVLYVETSKLSTSENGGVAISNGSYTYRVVLFFDTSGNVRGQVYSNGEQANIITSGLDYTNNNKLALKYSATSTKFFVNGFQIGSTDTSSTMPIGLSELAFDDGGGGSDFYGKTKQLMTFNQALTDSELEQITSWTSFGEMAKGQLYTIE